MLFSAVLSTTVPGDKNLQTGELKGRVRERVAALPAVGMGAMLKQPDDHLRCHALLSLQSDGVPEYIAQVIEAAVHIPTMSEEALEDGNVGSRNSGLVDRDVIFKAGHMDEEQFCKIDISILKSLQEGWF